MTISINQIIQTRWIALGAVFVSMLSPALAADIEDCRAIEDAAKRLACYDNLNAPAVIPETSPTETTAVESVPTPDSPVPEPVVTPEPTPTVEAAPAAGASAVLDDDFGNERIAAAEEKAKVRVSGHVSSCREDSGGQYRFYFDNGQIWKQKDNKRIPWRECDFDVTITKDFFGYKMLPAIDDRTIRVSRVR